MNNTRALTQDEENAIYRKFNECPKIEKFRTELAAKYVPDWTSKERRVFWETIICLAAEGLPD